MTPISKKNDESYNYIEQIPSLHTQLNHTLICQSHMTNLSRADHNHMVISKILGDHGDTCMYINFAIFSKSYTADTNPILSFVDHGHKRLSLMPMFEQPFSEGHDNLDK